MRVLFPQTFSHPRQAALKGLLTAKSQTQSSVSFADIRSQLTLTETELPDGVIHQIAQDEGWEVAE